VDIHYIVMVSFVDKHRNKPVLQIGDLVKCKVLVFYIGNILVDKNTLCNGFFLIGLSVLFIVFK
jgi:hypothetical protein